MRCLALPVGARSLAWSHRRRTEDNREARPHRDSEHSSTIRFIDALGCSQLAAMDPVDRGEEKQQRRQNDAHQDGSLPRHRPPGRRVNQPQRKTRRGLKKRGYEDPTPQGTMAEGGWGKGGDTGLGRAPARITKPGYLTGWDQAEGTEQPVGRVSPKASLWSHRAHCSYPMWLQEALGSPWVWWRPPDAMQTPSPPLPPATLTP